MLITLVALYILFNIGFSFYISQKNKNTLDYVFAGSKLPFWISSFAFFATWFGSEMIIGSASEFMNRGFKALIKDPFGASICIFLIGAVFSKHFYKMPYLSFASFFKSKYGSKVGFYASLCIIMGYVGWLAAQYIAFAVILKTLVNLPLEIGMIIGAIIFLLYVWWGGLLAISILDMSQTIIIIVGLLAVAIPIISTAGGLGNIIQQTPPEFFNVMPDMDFMSIATFISALITVGIGSLPQQDLYQRVKACKSAAVAKYSGIFSAFLYIAISLIPAFIILGIKVSQPELISELTDGQMVLPKIVMHNGNVFIQFLFFGAILSAIMSTASVCILAPATVFAENFVRPALIFMGHRKKVRDIDRTISIKQAAIAITIISLIVAFINGNIYHLATEAATITLVTLVVPFLFAIFAKKINSTAAQVAIFSGLSVWLSFMIFKIEFPCQLAGFLVSLFAYLITDGIIYSFFSKGSQRRHRPSNY